MIQRIQSLYLAAVLLLSIALFFIPVYSINSPNNQVEYFTLFSNTVYVVLNSIVALFAFSSILLFKNRILQIRLCNLNMLVICILLGTVFFFSDHSKTNGDSVVHYAMGCYVPLVQLLFCFLAMRAIRKDEELIRSADRLR